jgi:Ca-activated chloride channel family protein
MRIKTVGLLAAVTMSLTSLTVWSVTPKGGFNDQILTEMAANIETPEVQAETWKFNDGQTVKVEGRLGHAKLASNQDNETYLYLNVNAPTEVKGNTAVPVNLAIVIDRSGSMRGKRLSNAVEAARGMVRRLRDGDRVSIITYNTRAETLVPATTVDASSRERIASQLSSVTPNGDTCISCGVEAGLDALRGSTGMIQRMLLLSDGQATAGVRDVPGFRQLASRARDMGCTISSVGVDVDYNERIMTAIAIESNGRHYFVENDAQLPAIFDQELQSLVQTVATNSEMRIELAPGVQLLQVFDRAFRREGNSIVVPMGTLTVADNKTVLVKVRIPRSTEGNRSVANVSLRFDDLAAGNEGQLSGTLHANLTSDASEVSELDALVGGRLERAETAATLRDANKLFASGRVAAAQAKLDKKREQVRQRRRFAPKAKKRAAELEADFDNQLAALDDAAEGFASPPPASPGAGAPLSVAGPQQQTRKGRAAVRQNASSAADMAF